MSPVEQERPAATVFSPWKHNPGAGKVATAVANIHRYRFWLSAKIVMTSKAPNGMRSRFAQDGAPWPA